MSMLETPPLSYTTPRRSARMSPVAEKFEDEIGSDSPHRAPLYPEESRTRIFDQSPTNTIFETTVLYSMIKSKKWELVIERCCGPEKKEAGFWVLQNDGNFEWKSLPIHLACELQAPFAVVKALLDVFEPAIQMSDSLSRLPLHIACLSRASYDVIALLLETFSDATKVEDDAGCIPLHYACRKGAHEKVIECLLIYNHRGAYSTDFYKLLPIHYACKHNAPSTVIESLLRAHPYSTEDVDQYGRTPMDITKTSYIGPEKNKVIEALERNPSYWTMSLLNQVETLKNDVNQLETALNKKSQLRCEEIDRLEMLLKQLTDASNDATNKFKYIRAELEYENATLKNQVKKYAHDKVTNDDRIDTIQEENDRLAKELKHVQDTLKFENATIKVENKKFKTDMAEYTRENNELFDDNVRLTLEVNRLSEQLDLMMKQLHEMKGHASGIKDITDKIETTLNKKVAAA